MTINHVFRQAKFAANNAHFVFVQQLNGLTQLELHIVGQAAYIVVGLYAVLRFKDIGINGALSQEAHFVADLASFLFEYANELSADNLSLGFGLFYVNKLVQEAVGCVYVYQVCIHLVLEHVNNLLTFAFAHKAMVYMHADKLLANSLDQQCSNNGAVNAAEIDLGLLMPYGYGSLLLVSHALHLAACVRGTSKRRYGGYK